MAMIIVSCLSVLRSVENTYLQYLKPSVIRWNEFKFVDDDVTKDFSHN